MSGQFTEEDQVGVGIALRLEHRQCKELCSPDKLKDETFNALAMSLDDCMTQIIAIMERCP